MNRTMFNSSVFNGAGLAVGVISAAAAIVCSSGIEVHSTRVVRPTIAIQGTATTVVQATRVPQAVASFQGKSNFLISPTHTKPSFANFTTSAAFQGFVLREVAGQVVVLGNAELLAIPAGILANSDLIAGADLIAEATKIQPGYADAVASADFEVSTPGVNRYVVAQPIQGSGDFYAEVTINDETEAYAVFDFSGQFSAIEDGLVYRIAEASIEAVGEASADATYIQPGAADSLGVAMTFAGEPHSRQSPLAYFESGVSIHAAGTRVIPSAKSFINAEGRFRAAPVQWVLSAKSRFSGTSQVVANTWLTRFVRVNIAGTTSVSGNALRIVNPVLNITAQAELASSALRTVYPENITLTGQTDFKATPDITIRRGQAVLGGYALLEGEAEQTWRFGQASITGLASAEAVPDITIREGSAFFETSAGFTGKAAQTWRYGEMNGVYSAELTASGLRIVLPLGALHTNEAQVKVEPTRFTYVQSQISLASEFYADTIMNPESHDPSDRTFIRIVQPTTFYRPSAEIVFRRAA